MVGLALPGVLGPLVSSMDTFEGTVENISREDDSTVALVKLSSLVTTEAKGK